MSRISQAYDALKARLEAVLPNHKELTNAYSPEQNKEPTLKQGFGIAVGPAERSPRDLSCTLSVKRSIDVVLTRKHYGSEAKIDAKQTTEKALFEDQYLIVKDVERDTTLGVSDVVTKFDFLGDNGIEFVFTEDKPYLMLRMSFSLEYMEDLN